MKNRSLTIITVLLASFAFISMTVKDLDLQDPWDVPAKYEKMKNPYVGDADAEQVGRMLYKEHCASCHGSKGEGDGKKADTVDTEVPDFTYGSFLEQSDGSMYYKTFIGRDDMPGFLDKIPDEKQQWLVVNYIRTLGS